MAKNAKIISVYHSSIFFCKLNKLNKNRMIQMTLRKIGCYPMYIRSSCTYTFTIVGGQILSNWQRNKWTNLCFLY